MADSETEVEESATDEGATGVTGSAQLGVIFLTVFVDLIGFSIIFPLYPAMLEYYLGREGHQGLLGQVVRGLEAVAGGGGRSSEFYTVVLFGGLLGSLYSVLQFIFAPLWGRFSDRVGRKPVLMCTIGGLAASYLLWFFSGRFALLVASRLFGGVMSGNISVASAAVADSTGRGRRAHGMALIGVAFGLGFIIGPALGGMLSLVDLSRYWLGRWPGVNPFSAAAGGALALAAWNFGWVALRFRETLPAGDRGQFQDRPIGLGGLLRRFEFPGVNRANLIYFCYQLAFAAMEFTLTFLAVERFGYGPGHIAWMFVYVGLIVAVVQGGLAGRVVRAWGERRVALAGLILLVPGLILTGISPTQMLLYGGLGLLALGSALAAPSLTALTSLYTPSDRQGEVLGVFRSLGALSRAVGPLAGCSVYWRFGPLWPYFGGAVLMLLPISLAVGLPPVQRPPLVAGGAIT